MSKKIVVEGVEVEKGSDNVFADIGIKNPGEALTKARIVSLIDDVIKHRGLTQTKAAKLLGVPQPQLSRLLRGYFYRFSVERLFRLLNALDRDVEIVIKRKPRSRDARVSVVTL